MVAVSEPNDIEVSEPNDIAVSEPDVAGSEPNGSNVGT